MATHSGNSTGLAPELAEVDRIEASLKKFGDRFKQRNFSADEIAYCDAKRQPAVHYAGRWAAKEAFLKAVGIGIKRGIPMSSISIMPPPGRTRPALTVDDRARAALAARRVVAWDLNITHSRATAVAVAVAFFHA